MSEQLPQKREVYTCVPANRTRQLGPWRVLRLVTDGQWEVVSEHQTSDEAHRRYLELRRSAQKVKVEPCCGCSCGRCSHSAGRDDHTNNCKRRFYAEQAGERDSSPTHPPQGGPDRTV